MLQTPENLLLSRRFFPIFMVQFLGAFNDNVFRFALLTLITYRLANQLGYSAPMLNIVAAGIFILPFFLFSATGGVLADRFDKGRLVRGIKFSEVLIMLLGSVALVEGNVSLLLATLFLTGIQSALFGPVKYSILPSILPKEKLIHANALVEAGTFLSILLGTITGSLLILTDKGAITVSAILLLASLVGFVSSLFVPGISGEKKDLRVRYNLIRETADVIRIGADRPEIRRVIFGISWFWFFGFVVQSQMTPLAKEVLYADEKVFALFLVLFTLGIALGSIICHRVLQKTISAHLVPFAGVVISLLCVDLYFALSALETVYRPDLYTVYEFLIRSQHWRILFDVFGISVAAGFYIVPLYALIQSRSDAVQRSRVIAANNISNSAFMVVATILVVAVFSIGFGIADLFWMLAILNGLVVFVILKIVAKHTLRSFGRFLFKVLYRVKVKGLENVPAEGQTGIYVANHTSYLDGPLLMCLLPGMPVFAINTNVNKQWWASLFTRFFDVCPLDPTNPIALRELVRTLRGGRNIMIFPEGRITVTGGLMKLYEGPGRVADMTDSSVIPVHIKGAHRTPFSKLSGLIPLRWFPKIEITIHPAVSLAVEESVRGKERRRRLKAKMYDVMTNLIYSSSATDRTLMDQLGEAVHQYGGSTIVVEDATQQSLSYRKLLVGSRVLASKLNELVGNNSNVGVMLPNTVGTVVTYFALQRMGKVPAMINFSAGTESINSAIITAQIATIVTSRRFVEMANLSEVVSSVPAGLRWIYLEDVKNSIHAIDKLYALVLYGLERIVGPQEHPENANSPATILFTSGSEGVPKGVVLSHKNILSNHAQVKACIDFNSRDRFFNALPMFHSFGLSVGTLLPLLSGIYCYLYPSPLHFKLVPEMVYEKRATVIAGTDSFLGGYARYADSEDFQTVRYAIAGAEKLKETTRNNWINKFGIRIHEGYGVTETAPALSINTYSHFKQGSVGRLLPGVEYRLESVEGVSGGRLHVAGDNVMLGYLKYDRPGQLQPLLDGWHDTGDIVEIDDQGFVTILGRAKRFAKIGGEMVSLTHVESYLSRQWPENQHCVCAVTDERKGERLVLVTENPEISRKQLSELILSKGGTELMVPKKVVFTSAMPLLGSGKLDYGKIQMLAESV